MSSLQSHCGVTQGKPLSPMIFNVFVDAVIRHWVTVVGGGQEGAGQEGLGTSIPALSSLLYANGGLVVSPYSARLQGAFNALTGLFGRVGPFTNKGKTVSMACRPCHTLHAWSMEAYTRRVTGRGLLYRERLQHRVHFRECGVDLAAGSLTSHWQRQHGVGRSKAIPSTG